MKKRLIAILLTVVVLMVAGCGNSNSGEEPAGTDNQTAGNGTDELSTIEGTVLEINETNILINESGYENGECYLTISDDTVIYVDGKKSDISMIEVGQSIKAVYTGGIEEIYPGRINEVVEVIVEHPSGTEETKINAPDSGTENTEDEATQPHISAASFWDREGAVKLVG